MHHKLRSSFSDHLEKAVSLTRPQSPYLRYGLIFLVCLVAAFLFLGTKSYLGATSPFLFLLGAVLITSWFGGITTGIITFLFGLMLAWVGFIEPNLHVEQPMLTRVLFQTGLYMIECPLVMLLIHKRNKTYEEMQGRAAQQAVIASIGQFGLEEDNLHEFMDRVVKAIARTLGVDYVKILELLPDGKHLRIISGSGWKKGVVGRALVEVDTTSQAGFTLESSKPIIVSDLKHEKRFKGNAILHEHNAVSGISVCIPGHPQPYGVLSVHTKNKRNFTKDDVNFILALAHVLSTTIERRASEHELSVMAHLNKELVSLDPQQTLSRVVDTLVPSFADICEIYIKTTESKADLIEIKATTREKERIFREMAQKYPPVNTSKRPTAQVLRSGKPFYHARVPETFAEDSSNNPEHKKMYDKINLLSNIVIPIKIRNKTAGTIGFGTFNKGHIYTKRDFLLAQEIGSRVAVAIDNATLYQDARDAIQARDEFLSIASHELKTPLTSMLLQLQAVLHSIKSQSLASFSIEKTMTSLESTIAQSKRLSKLVNDLLNISLITTGRLELEREKTDLRKIVNDVTYRLKESMSKSGSSLSIEDGKAVIGNWDKIRLEQVVTNLITNAIKYGDGKPIEVEIKNSGKHAFLRVTDHGLGIPKEQQDKIFDRFQRGDVKSSIKGLGVGLYMVNEIVRAHKGKIELSSKPNEGSTFTVQLPL